jgi:glutamyl-tRNA reductase
MHTKDRQKIENFWVVGINYKKTDASVRGLFAVNEEQYKQLLSEAPKQGLTDLFVVSTCNRTEIYGFAENAQVLVNLLASVCYGSVQEFERISYSKNGDAAIGHLFNVASGLDSQILGDYDILGQIKNAVKIAKMNGFVGPFTERLINSVLQASKAIKTHTALSGGTVSTSFAAIQYIREYFDGPLVTPDMKCPATQRIMVPENVQGVVGSRSFEERKIVVLGTGKIGRTTCRNLVDYLGTHNITLINRTEETAAEIAKELQLKHAPIGAMDGELRDADIVIVSTSAAEPVIFKEHFEGGGNKLVIDLSVPSNVAKDAQLLPGITYIDVDMLSKIKDETLQKRIAEVPKAVAIIEEHIAEFMAWYEMRKYVPVLKAVKNKLKAIYIDPALLANAGAIYHDAMPDEKIQKVINALAIKMRQDNAPGCHYIEAINEFIA